MNTKTIITTATFGTLVLGLALVTPVFADGHIDLGESASIQTNMPWGGDHAPVPGFATGTRDIMGPVDNQVGHIFPLLSGTVTSVVGNTVTLSFKEGLGRDQMKPEQDHEGFGSTSSSNEQVGVASSTPNTFSVDVSNATLYKNGTTTTVTNILVGDSVYVRGTLSGAGSVTASVVYDGMARNMINPKNDKRNKNDSASSSLSLGNGEPIVAGAITEVGTTTITVANNNVTYTVDITSAAIQSGHGTTTLDTLKVGDKVIVQGVVNGTAITASQIVDQTATKTYQQDVKDHPVKHFFQSFGDSFKAFFSHWFHF